MTAFYKNFERNDGSISIVDFSLHYGCAIFEGIRSYKTGSGFSIVDLDAHIDRLYKSAEIIKKPLLSCSKEQLVDLIFSHVEQSQDKNLYIRPMVTFGDKIMGLKDPGKQDVWVIFKPFSIDYSNSRYVKGISLGISPEIKSSYYSKAKVSSNYLTSFVALGHESIHDYDDMLLMDQDGFICETSAQNIFFVKGEVVVTPRSKYALSGITQLRVIDICKSLGLSIRSDDVCIDDVWDYDEVFLTGTACEILPVSKILKHAFRSAEIHSVTKKIHAVLLKNYRG